MAEWGPELRTSAGRSAFDRRRDLQNNGLRRSSKNVCKESIANICYNGAHMSEREREGHRLVAVC